jgi:ribosome-binding protein aMBF1 (putative translation factor)
VTAEKKQKEKKMKLKNPGPEIEKAIGKNPGPEIEKAIGKNLEPEIEKAIGKRIRDIRTHQNMTLKFLSDKAGISYQQVQKYEMGKYKIPSSRLFVFSKIFNVPLDYLFGEIKGIEEKMNGIEN